MGRMQPISLHAFLLDLLEMERKKFRENGYQRQYIFDSYPDAQSSNRAIMQLRHVAGQLRTDDSGMTWIINR